MSNLTAIREESGISIGGLAETVGLSPSTIRRYESGKSNPRRVNALILADALGVPVCALTSADLDGVF